MLTSFLFIEHLVGLPGTPEAEGHRPVWCVRCICIPEAYAYLLPFPSCVRNTQLSPP